MAETAVTLVFIGKGAKEQLEIFCSVLRYLNDVQWYGELDVDDGRASIDELEDVETASVIEMVNLLDCVMDGLGLDIDFEVRTNIDEGYGGHTILRIMRSDGEKSVQEVRYNVEDHGGDFDEDGSAAEADEAGFEAALEQCASGEVVSVPFDEYFEECDARECDADVVREAVEALGGR